MPARFVRSVAIPSVLRPTASRLLRVMFVHFRSAVLVMSTRGKMEISLALSARPNTNGIKVLIRSCVEFFMFLITLVHLV